MLVLPNLAILGWNEKNTAREGEIRQSGRENSTEPRYEKSSTKGQAEPREQQQWRKRVSAGKQGTNISGVVRPWGMGVE